MSRDPIEPVDAALADWLLPVEHALGDAADEQADAVEHSFADVGADEPDTRAELPGPDPEMAAWLDRVRAVMHDEIDVRADRWLAEPPRVTRSRASIAVIAAIAAALLLGFAGWSAIAFVRDSGRTATQAEDALPEARANPTTADREIAGPLPAPTEVTAEVIAPSLNESVIRATEPRQAPPLSRATQLANELADLDALAQARWRAGDLAEATRLFERIVARAGRRTEAQTAYAELFTLAHQRGDAAGLAATWRDYLRKFPRGRHADDARAGLCRSTAIAAANCWRTYLDDFPKGSYRTQAQRALAEQTP